MTARARLALPEWAVATPDGYCHQCGTYPGRGAGLPAVECEAMDTLHALDHRVPGGCRDRDVQPADPARLVDREVLRVLQGGLMLGSAHAGDHAPVYLDPVMAERILAAVTDTIRIYTAGGAR